MDDFLKMDIFFVVVTLVVAVVGVLIAFALLTFLRILRTLERIAKDVEGEAKAIITDIDGVRKKVGVEGFKAAHLLTLATKTGKRLLTKSRRK